MADPGRAVQGVEIALVEGVANEAHVDVAVLLEAIVGDDAGGLLAAVLERVQRVIERSCDGAIFQCDPDDPAFFSRALGNLGVRLPAVFHTYYTVLSR